MAGKAKYRSQAGIVYDILQAIASEGKAPATRIMYAARLPYDRLRQMLDHLESVGLVREVADEDRTYYTLTSKGMETLQELRRTKRLLEQLGLRF